MNVRSSDMPLTKTTRGWPPIAVVRSRLGVVRRRSGAQLLRVRKRPRTGAVGEELGIATPRYRRIQRCIGDLFA